VRRQRTRALAHGIPAIADERGQRGGDWPVGHRLDLVIGTVRCAVRIESMRLVQPVRGRVPPMPRQVDAAGEGEHVVDDDDLLVVRRAERMVIVEPEVHAPGHAPSQAPSREGIPLERVESRVVPGEDVAAQLRLATHDPGQQLVEASRRAVGHAPRHEIEGCRDVPPDAENGVARLEHGLPGQAKIVGGVLDAREPRCARDAPAVLPRAQDRRFRAR
jgi:hypothetical protein